MPDAEARRGVLLPVHVGGGDGQGESAHRNDDGLKLTLPLINSPYGSVGPQSSRGRLQSHAPGTKSQRGKPVKMSLDSAPWQDVGPRSVQVRERIPRESDKSWRNTGMNDVAVPPSAKRQVVLRHAHSRASPRRLATIDHPPSSKARCCFLFSLSPPLRS